MQFPNCFFLNKKGVLYLISFTLWMSRTGRMKVWDSESIALYLFEKPKLVYVYLIRKQFLLTVFNNFTAFKKALEIKIRPLITVLTLNMQVQFPAWRLVSCGIGISVNMLSLPCKTERIVLLASWGWVRSMI